MKRIRSASVSLTLIACLGMLFPPAVLGEAPVARPAKQRVLDISLHEGGLLVGQVVNPQGKTLESVEVAIVSGGKQLARAKTDELGRFAMKGLVAGSYALATTGAQLQVRAWSQETAPPKSAIGALLVEGTTVRGQCSCNSGHGGHASYVGGGSYSGSGAASFNQGGHGGGLGGAASFNQGGAATYGHAGGGYSNSVVTSADSGYVTSGDTASVYPSVDSGMVTSGDPGVVTGDSGVVTSGDAGVTYGGGTGGYYDGSAVVNGAQGYVDGGAYGGGYSAGYGGSGAAGGYSYGGAAGSTGGGLLGSGGIFGGAGLLSSPWVIGAGVAAAVAIPVALDDDDAS